MSAALHFIQNSFHGQFAPPPPPTFFFWNPQKYFEDVYTKSRCACRPDQTDNVELQMTATWVCNFNLNSSNLSSLQFGFFWGLDSKQIILFEMAVSLR